MESVVSQTLPSEPGVFLHKVELTIRLSGLHTTKFEAAAKAQNLRVLRCHRLEGIPMVTIPRGQAWESAAATLHWLLLRNLIS